MLSCNKIRHFIYIYLLIKPVYCEKSIERVNINSMLLFSHKLFKYCPRAAHQKHIRTFHT